MTSNGKGSTRRGGRKELDLYAHRWEEIFKDHRKARPGMPRLAKAGRRKDVPRVT